MSVTTYTAKCISRHIHFWVRVVTGFGIVALVAGCGTFSTPIGSDDVQTPLDLTGSIEGSQNSADADIGTGDRQAIAFALAAGPTSVEKSAAFTWSNPISGNSGTILSLKKEEVAIGTECTRFETTANTVGGVRAYQGLACRDAKTNWTIVDLRQKDEAAKTKTS